MDYKIKILSPGYDAVAIMGYMLLEKHVFKNLCGSHKSLLGLYKILRKVEKGLVRVIGAFDDNKCIGVCYGFFDEKGNWINHSAFCRGVDAVAITKEIEAIIVLNVPELKAFVGNIPETNRAALLYAKKLGYRNNGYSDEYNYIDDNDNEVKCIEMIKVINEV